VAASAGAQDADERFRALDAMIAAARTSAGIPGVAVGVRYPGGEYLAGYGVTNVESPQPVDGDTLFRSARSPRR
jgi:CubicO group peptidase (beta-lactamase class C family)